VPCRPYQSSVAILANLTSLIAAGLVAIRNEAGRIAILALRACEGPGPDLGRRRPIGAPGFDTLITVRARTHTQVVGYVNAMPGPGRQ
jgi:hypothetical protein